MIPRHNLVLILLIILLNPASSFSTEAFRFAVMADSRCSNTQRCDETRTDVCGPLPVVVDHILARHSTDPIGLVVFPGDLIVGLLKRDAASVAQCNRIMYGRWRERMMPLLKAGMEVRVAAGNHELMSLEEPWGSQRCGKRLRPYVPLLDNVRAFKESLGDMLAGEAGPESDLGMTYSFNIGGCHFAVLAAYTMFQHNSISNQTIKWLDEDLQKARARNLKLFVVSHPPAFPGGGHMWDALPFYDPDYNCEGYDDRFGIDRRRERDRFWNILKKHKVVAYLCGHEHNIQIQNVEGVWHIVSGGLAPTLYPLNGVQQGQDANTILYDGQLQNPRASTIWPWNETRQSYWGWCLVTVLGDEATLEVFGAERMPVKKDDLRLLKKFVLREAGADL